MAQGGGTVGMAMVLALARSQRGPAHGFAAAASRAGRDVSAIRAAGGAQSQVGQESDAARAAAFVCHAIAGIGRGHPDDSGFART